MGQYFNSTALKALRTIHLNPRLVVPHHRVRNISEIPAAQWQKLKECGCQAIVFDKDNTLTAPYVDDVHPIVAKSLTDCLQAFGENNVAILSNSAGTPDDVGLRWKSRVEDCLGIKVIVHTEKKPGGFPEVLSHFNIEDESDTVPLAVVGDRLLTDVAFGNMHRSFTIHCSEPLQLKGDNPAARFVREVENRLIARYLAYKEVAAPNHPFEAAFLQAK